MVKNSLTLTEINKYFYETDSKLYRKIATSNKIKIGDEATDVSDTGYLIVSFNGKRHRVHRILYQIYNNMEILPNNMVIDHLDGNRLNNSKENLRIASRSQNSMNSKVPISNKLGLKNIHKVIKRNNLEYWCVFIITRNKPFTKLFRCDKFSLDDVIKYRDFKLTELHGEFANHE